MENPPLLKPFAEWMCISETNTQCSALTSLESTQPLLFGEVRGDGIDSGQPGHGIAQLALPGHDTERMRRVKRTQSLAEIAGRPRTHGDHSTQCREAFKELCRTEASFIHDLSRLLQTSDMAREAGVKQDDLDVVFRNAKDLFQLHESLLNSINDLSVSSARFIEDMQQAFLSALPAIHTAYKVFCGGSPRASNRLQQMKDARICWPCSGCIPLWSTSHLTLDAFLIKPIQRLALYPLLLEQIGRHAFEQHRILIVKEILEITLVAVNNATPLDTSLSPVQSSSIRKRWRAPWQRQKSLGKPLARV